MWYTETPIMHKPFIVLQHIIVQAISCPIQPTTCHEMCNTTKNKGEHWTKKAYSRKKRKKKNTQNNYQLDTLKTSEGWKISMQKALNRGKGRSFTPAGG